MSDLNSKVNTSDVLSFEDIQNTSDLTNKVASASAVKDISEVKAYSVELDSENYLYFRKVGDVVRLYSFLSNLSTDFPIQVTAPIDIAPKDYYAIVNVYSEDSPYPVIGTLWIYPNGHINIYRPKNIPKCYIYGTYLIS